MKKHRIKLSSDDEDVKNSGNVENYSNNKKTAGRTPKNVELCLEVEMDDEVRKIIKSPEECESTLLDVTVIKPKELHSCQTTEKTTLKKDEVKKLIASMEIEKEDKKKLLEKIFGNTRTVAFSSNVYDQNKSKVVKKRPNSPKRGCQYSEAVGDGDFIQDCPTDTDTLSALVSGLKKSTSPGRRASLSTIDEHGVVQQIYTTPKTYNSIKSLFACKNKARHDENRKPNEPCLCQNCAIVGILTDSQKKPFATEEMYDPQEIALRREAAKRAAYSKPPTRKKSVSFKNQQKFNADNAHTDCQHYIKHLSVKIQDLELRLAAQEEKAVPKEYFKRIITKLVNHISKLTRLATDDRSVTGSNKYRDVSPQNVYNSPKATPKYNKYYVSPALISGQKPDFKCSDQNYIDSGSVEGFWKWGSEILKPGIDLKNKIAQLLEETIQNFKKVWDREPKQEKLDEEMKIFVEEISKNLCKAIRDTGLSQYNTKEQVVYGLNSNSEISSRQSPRKHRRNMKNVSEKRQSMSTRREKREMCDVAYVNPKLKNWLEESQISFKIESDIESNNKINKHLNEQYKSEFVKTLEHTKASEKFKLWQSIWNQALANGQNKNDRVTIQMPDSKEKSTKRTISIDFTIGEMESILVGKNSSSNKKVRLHHRYC